MSDKLNDVITHIQRNELEAADNSFKELKEILKEEDIETIASSGYALQQLGFIHYAQEIYSIGKANYPEEESWALLEAELLIDDGQIEKAIDQLLTIPTDSSLYVASLLSLADAYQLISLPEVSFQKLQEARQLAPDQFAIVFGMAELKYEQGDFSDAIPLYNELFEFKDLPSQLKEQADGHYIDSLAWAGDVEAATEALERIPADKRTIKQRQQLAFYYYRLEAYEKAETLLKELYDDDALNADLLSLYAQVKTMSYNYEEALDLVDEALEKDPYGVALYTMKAEIAEKMGNYDTAFNALESASDLDPDNIEARVKMLEYAVAANKLSLAKGLITDLENENFVDPHVDWLKAKTFQLEEDYPAAEESYQSALAFLQDNLSFMEDYLSFLQETGNWSKIGQVFANNPNLTMQPSLATIYERYNAWKLDQDYLDF